MPAYVFKALDSSGKIIEETRNADSEQSLIRQLQVEGYMPIKVSLDTQSFWSFKSQPKAKFRLSQKEVLLFSRELSTLLQAGLPLDRALRVLMDLSGENSNLNIVVSDILEKVKGGKNLSEALESQDKVYSRFYINMIRAGEAGGSLETVLDRLIDYLESSLELRNSVVTALIYPVILVTMSVASIMLLLTFVVPQFTEMFENAGKELPIPTQIVVGTADWLQSYWWLLLLFFVFAVYGIKFMIANPARKLSFDRFLLRMPLAGDIICHMETANLCRTLGTLLVNGVSLLAALTIAKGTVGNSSLTEVLVEAETNLRNGKGLSKALIESGQYPKMAVQMIKMGEESGKLEEMLLNVAETYAKELRITIQRMLAMLEPALILGLGVVIAGIIISILMAILSVNDLAF
jgi:general secretion pathway protein F